jgi:hypothetical protein
MEFFWSPSTDSFYHRDINAGGIPADAVAITRRRHAELLAGRSAGREVRAGAKGKPELAPLRKPTVDQLRGWAVLDVKREARRRILGIASLERQANDNAAIALRGMVPADEQPSPAQFAAISAAIERRHTIDAVRAASNAIEATIATMPAANLTNYDAAADPRWPAQE